jgi:hypothetical protein
MFNIWQNKKTCNKKDIYEKFKRISVSLPAVLGQGRRKISQLAEHELDFNSAEHYRAWKLLFQM